jgi:cytochrome c oxidase subunit 3
MSPSRTRREAGNHRDGDIPDYGNRLRRARLGLGIGIATVTMLFVVFTVTYVLRRFLDEGPGVDSSTPASVSHWIHLQLPIPLLLLNTLLLLVSSATMEMARRQVTKRAALAPLEGIPGVSLGTERNLPWLPATIVLGSGFVLGQVMAWREMAARGYYLATTPSTTFVYLATILHAVHLGAGLIALLCAAAMGMWKASWDSRRIVVDLSAWYWHFMALLWVYLFGLLVAMS